MQIIPVDVRYLVGNIFQFVVYSKLYSSKMTAFNEG